MDVRERWRSGLRLALAAVYGPFGVLHMARPRAFLPIMPPWVPWPQTVVVATGACEVAGAIGLLHPRTRKAAAIGLALYAVCVYPANIYHAVAHRHVPPLPDSLWYHVPRLLFQPVFVWWALFAGGVTSWPWPPARSGAEPRSPRRRDGNDARP
jgi:uncharacterized membrane protein